MVMNSAVDVKSSTEYTSRLSGGQKAELEEEAREVTTERKLHDSQKNSRFRTVFFIVSEKFS
jgi:hypothetical protein